MEDIYHNADQIVIGIPSKGRLKFHVLKYLADNGMVVKCKTERHLQADIENEPNYKVVFVHPKDIPLLLEKKALDVGFTGMDLVHETRAKVRTVVKIGKGYVKMSIMVPENRNHSHPFHLLDQTVGTPFPNIARTYFDRLKVRVKIHSLQGASEGMPYLGLVDAIVDVVETGVSARENGLKIIADDLFDSECVIVVKEPELQENYKQINKFLRRIY